MHPVNDILWNNTFDMFEAAVTDRKMRPEKICEYAKKFPSSSLLTSVSPAVTTRYAEVFEKISEAEKTSLIKCKAKMVGRKVWAIISLVLMILIGILTIAEGGGMLADMLGEYGLGSEYVPYGKMIYAVLIGIAAAALGIWSAKTQFACSKTAEKSKKYTIACIAVAVVIILLIAFAIECGDISYIIFKREGMY